MAMSGAQKTQLGPCGGPRRDYGAFAGKETVVPPVGTGATTLIVIKRHRPR